jgi:protein-S-isoprenylcysteine O-methyltransferase Ste14
MEPASTTERRTTTIAIGRFRLEGGAALAVLALMLAAIVAAFVWRGLPRWPVSAAAILWLVFISYWSAAARTAAPAQSSESAASRRVHVRLMNGAFLLLFVPLLRQRFVPDTLALTLLGLALQVAAGSLGVWARRHLGRNWSGAITVAQDHQLVRTGPYRRLRHPIYTAMIGMFVGSALAIGEWHSLLGVALIAVAYARKIPLEERSLRTVFDAEYDEYRRSTWAVVPGVF